MCVNALTEINKTYPNLSFFFFFFRVRCLWKKKLDDLQGFLQLKMVTLKLRPGDYESHPTYVSSSSQKKFTYFSVVGAEADANYNSYIIFYGNVFCLL